MRVVRSVLGVLLALIGLLVGLAGAAAAFWLIGPDDTVKSGDQHLTSKGLAIASSPELLDRHGPVLHVEAHSTNGKPVFVGVARDFDVASYLKGFAHTSLVQVQYPIALTTQEQKGAAGPLAAPDTLDWWVAKANGAGTQSIAWPITDGPYDVVVMTADGKTAPDVQVDLGIEIPHAFLAALGVLLAGLVLLAAGILLILVRRRRPSAPQQVFTAPGVPAQQRQPAGPVRRVAAVGVVVALVSSCSAIPGARHRRESHPAGDQQRDRGGRRQALQRGQQHRQPAAATTSSSRPSRAGPWSGRARPATRSAGRWTRPARTWSSRSPTPSPWSGRRSTATYPMHFVVSAGISDTKDYRYLGVWERATAGSPWMLTFAAAPPAAAKVPDITGLRTVTNAGAKRWPPPRKRPRPHWPST